MTKPVLPCVIGNSQKLSKELLPSEFIEMAWEGERDVDKLCELALKSLGFGEL
jgi:hypothetical protein